MFAEKKTRNRSRGIISCIKCTSIPVFATCQVRLRNGLEPPKTWVLDWNSGLGMFVATNQEIVSEAWTRAFNAPDTDFHNGSGAATKWRETTRNTNFRGKVCGAKPNGHCRAPKWCENTQNMSFCCKKPRNGSRGINSCIKCTRYWFSQWVRCGNEMAWNHPKHEF